MRYATDIYPLVYASGKKQTVFIRVISAPEDAVVQAKIQPMEQYAIPHTDAYRINEETRYPFEDMTRVEGNLYSIDYYFPSEQKYNIRLRINDDPGTVGYVYAVDEDLRALRPFKGDTHLHTNESDGEGTPFEAACDYRAAGFDFISVTDHHKMYPSVDAKKIFDGLTSSFTVFRGEEVHNGQMGYFHIVNFGGDVSVNDIIENKPDFVNGEIERIRASRVFPDGVDAYACAYRIFAAEQIKKGGGVAIMAHPYWECYGEYHMQTADFVYLWQNPVFDALELLAGCDNNNNGNNLQTALWSDMRAEGYKIPIVGASDAHKRTETSLFDKQFSIVFASGAPDIKEAIRDERAVAVLRRTDSDFYTFGKFRYVKYARFLLDFYFPRYKNLTARHAELLREAHETGAISAELSTLEREISDFSARYLGFK